MSEYATVIGYIAMIIGGFSGLIKLIEVIMHDFGTGYAFGVALEIIFSEVLVIFYGIIPFLEWFVILFLIGLPFYGVYKLFEKKT